MSSETPTIHVGTWRISATTEQVTLHQFGYDITITDKEDSDDAVVAIHVTLAPPAAELRYEMTTWPHEVSRGQAVIVVRRPHDGDEEVSQ